MGMTAQPYETEHLPFDRMNEADVRAHVLDPLLRRLGYSLNGPATILREHVLKYTSLYLGRKKPGKDLKLQGNADYTLQVARHARWTLEAKAPDQALDEEVIQQAWSYAIHPEVQASYFAVSNGRLFELYATSSAWGSAPIISCKYEELSNRYAEIEAFLGPSQIARKHPNHLQSAGKPLGPNLKAFERIASGTISYHKSTTGLPILNQMQMGIVDGSMRRDSAGKIEVAMVTRAPFREFQDRIDALGLQVQTYVTDDEQLSVNPERPTTLRFVADLPLPLTIDLATLEVAPPEVPVRVAISATASGHLSNDVFGGDFVLEVTYHFAAGTASFTGKGRFELRLT
jgi:hypothetical protein